MAVIASESPRGARMRISGGKWESVTADDMRSMLGQEVHFASRRLLKAVRKEADPRGREYWWKTEVVMQDGDVISMKAWSYRHYISDSHNEVRFVGDLLDPTHALISREWRPRGMGWIPMAFPAKSQSEFWIVDDLDD